MISLPLQSISQRNISVLVKITDGNYVPSVDQSTVLVNKYLYFYLVIADMETLVRRVLKRFL